MSSAFSSIGILGREGDTRVAHTVTALANRLSAADIQVQVDAALAPLPELPPALLSPRARLCGEVQLLVVIGGDGTMLKAAHSVAERPVPLVGVNLGRLGFLTDISADTLHADLEAILKGEYESEHRLLLEAQVPGDGSAASRNVALNDVVVQKATSGRLIEFEIHVDGHFVCAYRADGMIVATPTGSTAYALSGGGPILHPSLDAITLVPICPHTLGDRPIVVKADSTIEIALTGLHGGGAQLSCDGQDSRLLASGGRVRVQRAAHAVTFIHPRGYDYYKILRTKLHWGRAHPAHKD